MRPDATGTAVDHAADATGSAVETAAKTTGSALETAADATGRAANSAINWTKRVIDSIFWIPQKLCICFHGERALLGRVRLQALRMPITASCRRGSPAASTRSPDLSVIGWPSQSVITPPAPSITGTAAR